MVNEKVSAYVSEVVEIVLRLFLFSRHFAKAMHDAHILRVKAPGRLLILRIVIHHGLNNTRAKLFTNRDVFFAAVDPCVGLLLSFFVSFISLCLGLGSKPANREDPLALPGHE